MKKFTNRQYILLITATLSFIILSTQLVSFNINDHVDFRKNKYKKSIDSVETLVAKIKSFQSFDCTMSRDYFNFKEKKKAVVKVAKQVVVKKRNYTWVKTIKPYTSDKIKFVLFFNGQARFNVKGKKQMLKIGDKVVVGRIVLRQKDVDSGVYTGKVESKGEYKGRVLAIQRRAVYIDTFYPKKVLLFKPSASAKFFNRSLIPKIGSKVSSKNKNNNSDDEFELRERMP